MLQRFLFEIEMSNLLFFFTFYSSNNFFFIILHKTILWSTAVFTFFIEQQISLSEWFLKYHATLKRVMMLKNSTLHHRNQLYF